MRDIDQMLVTPIRGNPLTRDKLSWSYHQIPPNLQDGLALHPSEAPHQRINAIKNQSLVRHPKSIQYDPALSIVEEYCSYHDSKRLQIIHCRSLREYLEEPVCQGFLKEYVLTLGQPLMQGSRALCLLSNRKTWSPSTRWLSDLIRPMKTGEYLHR